MKIFNLFCAIYLITIPFTISGQEIADSDYRQAVSYLYDNYNNKTVFNLHTEVHWFADSSGLWFIDYSREGKVFKTVSMDDYSILTLFDHEKLATGLNSLTGDSISANNLPLTELEKDRNGNLKLQFKDKSYLLNITTHAIDTLAPIQDPTINPLESLSPDGRWIAYTKDQNLWVRSVDTDEKFQLSHDGKEDYEYGSYYGWYDLMEGENGKRPKNFRVHWSEDSKWISTYICDTRTAIKMYMLDWSIDSLFRPRLLSYYRGSPGDTLMVLMDPVFYHLPTRQEIKTDLPKNTHINTVQTQWLTRSGFLIAQYPERGFQKNYVLKLNLNTNTVDTLIKEESSTNIDGFKYMLFEEMDKILFLSQRNGWRQMYAVDLNTGDIQSITKGNYYINDISWIDRENNLIYFMASGVDESLNPYHQQLYKTTLSGVVTLLTPEKTHHRISISKDHRYIVDNYSTITSPTKTVLRELSSGKVLANLTEADVSQVLDKGWRPPLSFELTAKDGLTTIYGALWKPTDFNPKKKYPLIDHSYTGPHTQVFPKSFDLGFSNQSLAELGFIIMRIDGLGTAGRSKAFLSHSYKNMGNNLEDHVLAIQYLGRQYSWIDTSKVGIYGHSAGAYDAGHAMVAFPDIYKVGVASSGDHDFRMEKAWWPEMYMGWPVDSTYHEVSNITLAPNLRGKLLLIHGALDDNVNASATFKLAEALVKADKDFDLLILPSQRHGYRGEFRQYFVKKRWNYFVQHLRGVTPIWSFAWK